MATIPTLDPSLQAAPALSRREFRYQECHMSDGIFDMLATYQL